MKRKSRSLLPENSSLASHRKPEPLYYDSLSRSGLRRNQPPLAPLILGFIVLGSTSNLFPQDQIASRSSDSPSVAPIRLRNVAEAAGLDFILENHPTPQKHLIETMPGGVAVFDYDGDGLTDIYFTNGASIPSLRKETSKYFNRLYRNLSGLRFRDVTQEAGVTGGGYSIGAAVADFNNDGDTDLFVAGVRRNILYRNTGKGTFEDITAQSGIKSDRWSVAAGWFDYDNDGLLDLFVVNYLQWSLDFDRYCGERDRDLRVYCHPRFFQGLPNTLYHNRGNGTFEDVSEKSGILEHVGKGMSVAFSDYDQDGHIDAFVSNDKLPNFLFHNQGDGTFEEVALLSGSALLDHGEPVSSMGTDFRDYDNDGRPDIIVTALKQETFPLFRNDGSGFFSDASYASKLGELSVGRSGWSTGFFDFNNDGWKDLFTANSHVSDLIERFEASAYREPNSIFANQGQGSFQDVSKDVGESFLISRAHRGSAFADFNNDGRMDIVVTSLGERPELWENVSPERNHWIVVKPVGTRSNRDGIGAVIRIGKQSNIMTSSVGYASSSHHGVHFGLGRTGKIERIEILWPSGQEQVLKDVDTNQVLKVEEPR